jgi:DNA-binding MarR family transcriptional regulator
VSRYYRNSAGSWDPVLQKGEEVPYLARAERRYRLDTRDYAQLAAFRHALRAFLQFSEDAAADVGLTTRHYQAMLVLRACPPGDRISIRDLAKQLVIKLNSAVGLVDRLEQEELIVRRPSLTDRRRVELHLTARGRKVLAALAAVHRRELARLGGALHQFFAEVARLDGGDAKAAARATVGRRDRSAGTRPTIARAAATRSAASR